MSAFEEYLKIQPQITQVKYFDEWLQEVREGEVPSLVPHINELAINLELHCVYHNLISALRIDASPNKKVDIDKLLGLLYLLLHSNDDFEDSEIYLDGLNILILYGNHNYAQCVFDKLSLSESLYTLALKKLSKRAEGQEIPRELLYDFNRFLQLQKIPFKHVQATVEFLFIFIRGHFNMIQSLHIYDKQCSIGFLAFVCLSSVIKKRYDGTHKKPVIIEYVFNCFELNSKPNSSLSEVQQRILQSNFRSFVRQVSPSFETKSMIYAGMALSKLHHNSTAMVLLFDQLPIDMYEKVVKVIANAIKMRHDPDRQMFCFRLLESPYMFDDLNGIESYYQLIGSIIVGIMWPLKKSDPQITVNTARLIDKILSILDKNIQTVMVNKLINDEIYNVVNVLNYIYQCCDPSWAHKSLNQLFISIFCKMTVATDTVYSNSFLQFSRLIDKAAPRDLLPCLDGLMKLLILNDTDIYNLICPIMINNAHGSSSKDNLAAQYLIALYKSMFSNLAESSKGATIALNMLNYGFDMQRLLKRMITSKLIKPALVETLVQLLFEDVNTWSLLEIVMPEFNDTPLPRNLNSYWAQFGNGDFFNQPAAVCFLSTFSKFLQFKTTCFSHELSLLTAIITFIQDSLNLKTLPVISVHASLILYKKVYHILNCDLQQLVNAYREIEDILQQGFKQMAKTKNIKDCNFLHRDLVYYQAINTIFLEKPEFAPSKETTKQIMNCLLALPLHNFSEYPDYGAALIQCCTQISLSDEGLHTVFVYKLNMLLKVNEPKLQVAALSSLYDMVLTRRSSLEDLENTIFDFFTIPNAVAVANAITMYITLISKEYVMPEHWQLFIVCYLLTDTAIDTYVGLKVKNQFFQVASKFFEKHIVHIILYFNKTYELKNYELTPKQIKDIPDYIMTPEIKQDIYFNILRNFTHMKNYRAIRSLYNVIIAEFNNPCMKYPEKFELLQDVICLTLFVMKPQVDIIPASYKYTFKNILNDIKKMVVTKHDDYSCDPHCNSALKAALLGLINVLKIIDYKGAGAIPEIMFALLTLTNWYNENVKCIISEEGPKGNFKTQFLSIPKIYNTHKDIIENDPPSIIYRAISNSYLK